MNRAEHWYWQDFAFRKNAIQVLDVNRHEFEIRTSARKVEDAILEFAWLIESCVRLRER